MTAKHRRRGRRDLAPELRGHLRRVTVEHLLDRDGDGCFFCLGSMGADCTIEHLRRWADGGGNEYRNLALAHSDCNYATQNLTA